MFPDASNDKAPEKRNASTGSQNYLCIVYTLSVFTLMESYMSVFLLSIPVVSLPCPYLGHMHLCLIV